MAKTKNRGAPATLSAYGAKRDFRETPEPGLASTRPHEKPIFVVQEHHATRLHYDFRLEVEGVLKSWAVTKEPSFDPAVKRLAVRVEDHPLAYADFSGKIPEGHYGAGEVFLWDRGAFENLDTSRTLAEGIDAGKLSFALHGAKLKGRFSLVRMRGERPPGELAAHQEPGPTREVRERRRGFRPPGKDDAVTERPRCEGPTQGCRAVAGGGDGQPPGQAPLPG